MAEKYLTETSNEPKERKAYDGRDLKPGEVLVPMMAYPERVRIMGAESANIRTWNKAGRRFPVMFYPVPEAYYTLAMQQFSSEMNEFLGENRDARCLIPQPDGSHKLCPKKNGDNRVACKDCPHNGEYERQDKTIDSLDALMDDNGYEPSPVRSAEDEFMLGELFTELMQELKEKYPREAEIVTMYLNDMDRKEMIEALGLKPSQGYNAIAKAMELVKEILYR